MKRLAIVSNKELPPEYAQLIDSHDEVARFSHCVGWGGNAGSKTTMWVTRSYCDNTRQIQRLHNRRMTKAIRHAHTAYIMYGFPEYDRFGVVIGQEAVKYDERVVRELTPNPKIKCYPVNMRVATLMHPTKNPTTGFMFILGILENNWFSNYKISLVGWDFDDVDAPHNPDWELEQIASWISLDERFKKIPGEAVQRG